MKFPILAVLCLALVATTANAHFILNDISSYGGGNPTDDGLRGDNNVDNLGVKINVCVILSQTVARNGTGLVASGLIVTWLLR